MTDVAPLLVAQTLGEYGALAGIAGQVQAAASWVEGALREPRSAVPIVIGVVIAAYFLLRRRA
jgi:purine-cytosine permease-like protein